MIPIDEQEWAQQLFGESDLGDARRTMRLVDVASRMAKHTGSSLAKSCETDQAALLGSYQLMRNGAVKPEAIRASGFAGTAKPAQEAKRLLAIEDTTCVSYEHAVASQLGLTGGKQSVKRNGFMVHSVLLLDAESGHTIGLIEQQHWQRDPASYGKNHTRKQRAYPDRESYKWEQASIEVAKRLGPAMQRTLSVCDRESDIYDYLWYKYLNNQRFVAPIGHKFAPKPTAGLKTAKENCLMPCSMMQFRYVVMLWGYRREVAVRHAPRKCCCGVQPSTSWCRKARQCRKKVCGSMSSWQRRWTRPPYPNPCIGCC
jgi:hypothetical protein